MTRRAIAYHCDLDGLYSGMILDRRLGPMSPVQLDYGQDFSKVHDEFDEFYIVDFGQNPFGEKTKFWLDHHFVAEGTDTTNMTHDDSDSCVRSMGKLGFLEDDLTEEELEAIDIVDSAKYDLSKVSPGAILFPTVDNTLEQYMLVNQLLRRNRKTFISKDIFEARTLNPLEVLDQIERSNHPKIIKYEYYLMKKQNLYTKIQKEQEDLILSFGKVPLLNTESFSFSDWVGWDLNIFGLLKRTSPFLAILYKINNNINLQVLKNIFYEGKIENSLYEIIEDLDVEKEGHDNILNFHFDSGNEAFKTSGIIFDKISESID